MKILILYILFYFIDSTTQSECIVTEWGNWSPCFGGCSNGLIVRNRDVLQPPLPELTVDGRMMQRLCPHLYETRYCDSTHCETSTVNYEARKPIEHELVNSARSLVEKQMQKVGSEFDADSKQLETKKMFTSESDQLMKLDEVINKRFGTSQQDESNPTIDISSQKLSNKQWKKELAARNNWSPSSFRDQPTPTSGILNESNIYSNTATTSTVSPITTPITGLRESITSRRSKQPSELSINFLLRKIEQALDSNQPLDEKYIRNALRRNRKLSKLLVDAYRHRQTMIPSTETPIITNTEQPAFFTGIEEVTTQTSTTDQTTTTPITTTTITPMLFWPKTGYIPNTRKHASEITSQLYMTNDIVQTLADEPIPIEINPQCSVNRRCCKINKEKCGDGTDPRPVKRWYRPVGSSRCVAYHYPRCSAMEEMEELPILFEQNCQDICFEKPEKRVSPLFNLEIVEE